MDTKPTKEEKRKRERERERGKGGGGESERERERERERSKDDVIKSQRIQECATAHRNSKDTK